MHPSKAERASDILTAARFLFRAGDVVEIRVPKAGREKTISGYADDPQILAKLALENDCKGPGVYWTINQVIPALKARASDRVRPWAEQTTSDADVTVRRNLLLDIDAVRPSGISSTDAEHKAALDLAAAIRAELMADGWPEPLVMSSGNGAYLIYRLPNLQNDDHSRELVKGCLAALAARFNTDLAKVDESTFNAARVAKIPGTTARKGDSTAERPHRVARVLDTPDTIEAVRLELLERLAEKTSPAPRASTTTPRTEFDIDRWLANSGLNVIEGPEAYDSGRRWILRSCPFNPEHTKPVVLQLASGAIVFRCLHRSCSDKNWRTLRSLVEPSYAERNGKPVMAAPAAPERSAESPPSVETRFCKHTEYGNCERLVKRYRADILYCPDWRKWLVWDGQRWDSDATAEIMRMAKVTVRNIYHEAAEIEDKKLRDATIDWARRSEKAAQLRAMIALAESEPGVPVLAGELDSDQWLVNCPNGTIDLHTGELRLHARTDRITKLAPVEYHPQAQCPVWLAFLDQIFEPHKDLVPFIQRAVGYTLTGNTREQCLFLLHGTGRNGKGVFIKTLAEVLGDYAGTADFSAFVQRKHDIGPRDDVANMKGKRFVSAQESNEGARLAESVIKWLTGGDLVRARRLYENSSEFLPTHKIWLATNHKPTVRGTDVAIWSRIKLVPFDVCFEGREDRGLKDRLRDELPGILTWAVEGCLLWQESGLAFPESVTRATEEYRAENDQVGRFISEQCVKGNAASAMGRALYSAYRKWAEEGGEKEPMTETAFCLRMGEKGFVKEHGRRGSEYMGIGLMTPVSEA
jgi:P4 family phage/plasmid primase-like protien